jgi:signal transduction histidine kinase
MLLGGDLGGLAEPQKEVLLKAAQSNDRMIKLVNDLLNVDHIESGKSEYVYVPLMVTDLISSVLTELKPIAEQHGVTLQFDQGNRHFAPVSGDRDKLRGVFQNLIDNAIKYTSQGGAVRIGINEDDSHIKVSIADTGIGIPAIDQQKVFSKFFRSKNAVKVATDGTGLGLFIVREIVTQHKGKIWFDSIEGTGTTFNVVIPKLSPDSVRMAAYGTM